MLILDGKVVRDKIAAELRQRILAFSSKPKLVIIQIGENEESATYIQQKKRFGESIGAVVEHVALPADTSERDVLSAIKQYNSDSNTHGIIIQMPIPDSFDRDRVLDAIAPEKDVDGLGSASVKALWEGKRAGYMPATTKGILSLLEYYKIPIAGKNVVVVGRSFLVGKPTAQALLNLDATVTIAHSKTVNLPALTQHADILIVATGNPHFIQRDHVRAGQVIIDVGITAVTGEKLDEEVGERTITGDVHFDAVKDTVHAISPVPGGVGPMTVASLFENLVTAFEIQNR
ncbi:MAG: bifunctional 5,10-methylenetetrahydrofolate dehydrogenase/5,10-methenyltetrahydrofolate cyclohydrolase [bacterium]|nr:bifunctional 5,10-methylenetetrahydrofolate dehydrogenase/5,10-methenyltetrahydrofolate cyclohydrolase [bacterium]